MLFNYKENYKKVRALHEGRSFLTVHRTLFIVMHLSELLTPIMIALKINPNTITYVRTVFGLIGLFLIPVLGVEYLYIGISMWMICYLFDCIDGDVARTTEKSSMLGRYMDGMSDIFMQSLLFLVFGVIAFQETGQSIYMIFGAFTCFLFAVGNLNIDRFANTRRWIIEDHGIDLGKFRFGNKSRHLINILMDLFFLSMILSVWYPLPGSLINIMVGFIWGNYIFWYYMILAWKKLPGIEDQPKSHFIGGDHNARAE